MRSRLTFTFPVFVFLGIAGAAMACNDPYPPSMVKAFMSNCNKEAQLTGFCSCVIVSVEKTIPLNEFIEVGSHPGGINKDPRYARANQECAKKFPLPQSGYNDSITK